MSHLVPEAIYSLADFPQIDCVCQNCSRTIRRQQVDVSLRASTGVYEFRARCSCHNNMMRYRMTPAEWFAACRNGTIINLGTVFRELPQNPWRSSPGEWDEAPAAAPRDPRVARAVQTLMMSAEEWNAAANGNLTTSPTITLTVPEPKIAGAVGSANLRSPSPPKRKGRWLHL